MLVAVLVTVTVGDAVLLTVDVTVAVLVTVTVGVCVAVLVIVLVGVLVGVGSILFITSNGKKLVEGDERACCLKNPIYEDCCTNSVKPCKNEGNPGV